MRTVRLAFRTLFRTPFVTTVAILSLALGIGANTAIFSLTDQVLLRPLPVPEPDRLVALGAPGPKPVFGTCNESGPCDDVFSYPMFRDLERSRTSLRNLAAFLTIGVTVSADGEAYPGDAAMVSGSYFPTLEITPAVGRLLGTGDDVEGSPGSTAVLSYAFWHDRLGADRHVVGSEIKVNGQAMTVVGVAPRGFEGTTFGQHPIAFVPLSSATQLNPDGSDFVNRRNYWLYVFGRLEPGATMAQAERALNAAYTPILNGVEAPLQVGMSDATLAKFRAKRIAVTRGDLGQSLVRHEARTPLLMLFGVTLAVLLIACANIANLLMARGAGRAREMGLRLALGGGRRHLLAQLMTESVLLGLSGGIASLVVAAVTLKLLVSLLPEATGQLLTLGLEPRMVGFAALLALATGVLFGILPALHNSRGELVESIRGNTGQIAGNQKAQRFRAVLVTAQITLASGFLICAGLFLKSLVNVSRVDLGVRADDVVTFALSPSRAGLDTTAARQLFGRVEDELSRLPGVTAVTSSGIRLLSGRNLGTGVAVEGFQAGPDVDNGSRYNRIGAGYFAMLGIPVLAGREFTAADGAGAPRVAIVNEAFARKFHLGANPVGKYMSHHGSDSLNIQIIGVVKDAKYSQVKEPVPPQFFVPWRQYAPPDLTLYFYARTRPPAEQQLAAVSTLMRQVSPVVPVEELRTMPEEIRDNVYLDRLISTLSAVFAALATLLAAVGLYGVLAYTVQQRTREIGVRIALGADRWSVRALIVRQMGLMIVTGGALGLGVALGMGRLLQSQLYEVKGWDPSVFALSLAVLAGVAALASYLPARRATRVDPVEALRAE